MNHKQLLITLACSLLGITCSASQAAVLPKEKLFTKPLPQPPVTPVRVLVQTEAIVDQQEAQRVEQSDEDLGDVDALCNAVLAQDDDSVCFDTATLECLRKEQEDDEATELQASRLYARPESAYIDTDDIDALREDLKSALPEHRADSSSNSNASANFSYEQAHREQERAVALRMAAMKSPLGKAGILVVRDKAQQGAVQSSSSADMQKPSRGAVRVSPPSHPAPMTPSAVKGSKERRLNRRGPQPDAVDDKKTSVYGDNRASVGPRFLSVHDLPPQKSDPAIGCDLDQDHEYVKAQLDAELLGEFDEDDLYSQTLDDVAIGVTPVQPVRRVPSVKAHDMHGARSNSQSELIPNRGSDTAGGSVRGKSKKERQERAVVPAAVSAPTQAKQTTLAFTPDEQSDPQRRVKKAYNMCLLKLKPAQGYSIPQWPKILDDFREHLYDLQADGIIRDIDIAAEEKEQSDWFFFKFIAHVKVMGYGIIGDE